jgi:NAD(P)-dependent dehydrogenase (short-subunit alcohol dehydrogenase family)
MKILVLGGYGIFGGRLCELLAGQTGIVLVVAGRSLAKAQALCGKLTPGAQLEALALDRCGNLNSHLTQVKPDLLIDASGPFQNYGKDAYRVIRACLACHVNYMDFADASDFVRGVQQFDQEAQALGLYVLSGVSSFPVLTAAVVRHLANGWDKIIAIRGGIAPSPYAVVGENVIRAVAAYAGQRVPLVRQGKPAHGYALTEIQQYTISPPGRLPLHSTRFSLVDVPDLQVLPPLWPDAEEVWMGAGPVPEVLHRMLNGLAWLVRLGVLRSLSPFAVVFFHAINRLRWGEHRGGMFVEVRGVDASGQPSTRSWHLLAEGDDGPYIPCFALQALVEHALNGNPPQTGARPATADLELEDYQRIFGHRAIHTGERQSLAGAADASPFQKVFRLAPAATSPSGGAYQHRSRSHLAWPGQRRTRHGHLGAHDGSRIPFPRRWRGGSHHGDIRTNAERGSLDP